MKLIIDISDDLYEKLHKSTEYWACCYVEGWQKTIAQTIRNGKPYEERPQGECKDCKYFQESLCENSPNGWCSIRRVTQEGDLETQVPKDYYCSWFEKGGAK